MGLAFQGICHNTVGLAQASFCQAMSMSDIDSKGQIVITTCRAMTATGVTVDTLIGTVASTRTINYPTFLTCTYDGGAALSLQYFAIALGFLALIAAGKAILNIFRGRTDVA